VAHSTTVSLVLGGGGARGLAHIGVIQWLTENGYEIRSIAGSSMGALVGGIFATSKLEAYAQWVLALERMQVLRMLDPAFGRPGLFKGERIMGILRKLIGDRAIEDLPVSFTAVATDLESGEEVWLRDGKLFDAIRASIAIPLVFTPFEYRGRKLLDGSLVNPVPIAPIVNDTNELTVVVTLSGPVEPWPRTLPSGPSLAGDAHAHRRSFAAPPGGMIEVALASMEAMQNTIARLKLAAFSPDVTVKIPRNACGFYEFWRAKELIALGRERTAQAFAATGHRST
jgi:NTE family protein